jgi:uncharacterized protein YjbI with pentapeptide repeats
MTASLNFANQDLRDRSFRGQNLAGANFSGADLRGCDFSRANLQDADFNRARTGQSQRQLYLTMVAVLCGSLLFALTVGLISVLVSTAVTLYLLTEAPQKSGMGMLGIIAAALPNLAKIGVGTFAAAFTVSFAGAFLYSHAVLLRTMLALSIIISFSVGFFGAVLAKELTMNLLDTVLQLARVNLASTSMVIAGTVAILGMIALLIFQQTFRCLRYGIGTTFKQADLSYAKFDHALLHHCDFSHAELNGVDWQAVHFTRCKFSPNSQPVPLQEH